MREINYGVFIGRRKVINLQFIVIGQCVNDSHAQVAGIALLTVVAKVSEFECGEAACLQRARRPDNFVESLDAAVQVILVVVSGEFVFDSVEAETPLGNAVAVTTYERAQVARVTWARS